MAKKKAGAAKGGKAITKATKAVFKVASSKGKKKAREVKTNLKKVNLEKSNF